MPLDEKWLNDIRERCADIPDLRVSSADPTFYMGVVIHVTGCPHVDAEGHDRLMAGTIVIPPNATEEIIQSKIANGIDAMHEWVKDNIHAS